jgi:hypothetical protein
VARARCWRPCYVVPIAFASSTTAAVVATNRHGQPEGEDEGDETEQGRLEDAERLAEGLGVSAELAAEKQLRNDVPRTIPRMISPSSRLLRRKNTRRLR